MRINKSGRQIRKWVIIAAAVSVIALCGCRASSPSTSPANSQTPTAQQLALVDDLRKLVATQCGAKAEAIDLDASLETQGCDDLDVVELVMTVEEKYSVSISDDQLERATINNLARIIGKR
jgi:acyl carrier protein